MKNRLVPLVLMTLLGLALIAMGTSRIVLGFAGERATGIVTSIRREGGERDEAVPNRYSYSVGYEFVLDDATIVSGNTKVIGSATGTGISAGPIAVRYFKVCPSINALETDTGFSMGSLLLIATGIFLVVVALRIRRGGAAKEKPKAKYN
ncbi:MAG: hypothetical protein PHO66_00135 [Eubacteriales bacterium]|nr:hypothetical protein [Eubacteriales bacterium]